MADYWLAKHVYLCNTDDHVVILDLKADRYLALSRQQSDALGSIVVGWPRRDDSNSTAHDTDAIATRLLRAGLLTTQPALGKDARPASYIVPAAPLVETALLHTLLDDAPRPPKITPKDVLRLASAYIGALIRMRRCSLERIISNVKGRRIAVSVDTESDIQLARQLVTKFRLMRAFFYDARNKCLLDSYVLIEFLAKYRVYPVWIFAVKTRPFIAHCWLQQDDLVFNDSVEHVGNYIPIMVA
jgi:hypothetical protein